MEHPRALGAKAWAGASAAATALATRGMAALRRAPGARQRRLGLHQAAKLSSRRTGGDGGAVLLARPGAPRLPGPPRLRPPYSPPVHGTPQDVRDAPPLASGPGRPGSPKRPKLDLPTDQGRAASVGSAQPGGGDVDPFSPPAHRRRQLRAGA